MKRAELEIAGNPGVVLARVASTLLTWLGPEGCVLGGGTVLAARWQHRVSMDIELFTDHERFAERVASRRQEVADAMEVLVVDAGEGAVEVERGWLRVHFREGPVALMTIPRPTVRDTYVEYVQGTDIPTESTAEILARSSKAVSWTSVCSRTETCTTFWSPKSMTPTPYVECWHPLPTPNEPPSRANSALPARWSSGEPVREPAYPDLLDDLVPRARRLFEPDRSR